MSKISDDERFGEITQLADGRWQLVFRRLLPHAPQDVWRALTDPAELAAWFPTTIEGERAAGAPLRFSFPNELAPPMDGEMLAYEPPQLMELRWGPDVISLQLRAMPGGTELTLRDTLEERGKGARDGAGWHTCLDGLAAHLDGDRAAPESVARWKEVHPHYVASFGPEAATLGPPEGFDS